MSAGWGVPSGAPEERPGQGPPGQPVDPRAGAGHPGYPSWSARPIKPGIIPLRPLGVGELLDGAISAIRAQPRTMIGLSALFAAAIQLVQVPLVWALLGGSFATGLDVSGGDAFDAATGIGPLEGLTTAGSVVGFVLTLIGGLVLTGLLTSVVSRAVLGERLTAGEAWRTVRPRLPTLFAITGLLLLIAVGIILVLVGPGLLILAAGGGAAGGGLAVLGGLVALVLLVYVYVTFALASPAAVLERAPARRALSRSRTLLRGSWWRGFGILLLINFLGQLIASILAVPLALAAVVLAAVGGGSASSLLAVILLAVGSVIANAVVYPFTAAGTVLLYVDQRMRREGLDIALASAAAASAAPGASTPDTPRSYGSPGAPGSPGSPGSSSGQPTGW